MVYSTLSLIYLWELRVKASINLSSTREKLRSLLRAGVNKVFVRNANNPMPTGYGEAGTKLLSSFEDEHYSSQGTSNRGPLWPVRMYAVLSITCGFDVRVYAKS